MRKCLSCRHVHVLLNFFLLLIQNISLGNFNNKLLHVVTYNQCKSVQCQHEWTTRQANGRSDDDDNDTMTTTTTTTTNCCATYYAALLHRRGPHYASHSVCPSVCPSVALSLPSVTSRHLANYNDTHVLFGTHWGPHIVRPSRPHKLVWCCFIAIRIVLIQLLAAKPNKSIIIIINITYLQICG